MRAVVIIAPPARISKRAVWQDSDVMGFDPSRQPNDPIRTGARQSPRYSPSVPQQTESPAITAIKILEILGTPKNSWSDSAKEAVKEGK